MVHKMKKKKVGGFTLIELIVVIAILGILAAIVAPRLLGFRQTAEAAADDALMETANKAIMLLHATDSVKTTDVNNIANILTFLKSKSMVENDAEFHDDTKYHVTNTEDDLEQGTVIRKGAAATP